MPTTDSPAGEDTLAGWVTTAYAEALWADAELIEDSAVRSVLAAAHEQAVDYLTDTTGKYVEPDVVPEPWKVAQVMLARHLWARMRTGNSDQVGIDGLAVSTYPLVLEARNLLRPKTSPFKGML